MLSPLVLLAMGPKVDYPAFAVPRLEGVTRRDLPAVTGRIAVDQFGYRPKEAKVAVISDPQREYNAGDDYTPGPELQLRDVKTGRVVFSGKPVAWRGGAVHEDSGDKGWWFDFSSVRTAGEYYVYDPTSKQRSPVVRIGDAVFRPVLRAASRMFYYQRLGEPILAKHAEGPWAEEAGLLQDKRARNVRAKEDSSQERDLSGGWMDAGDTNKYPPFNGDVLHPLLYAYRANPKVFGDKNNIPESGNGVPDLLDEIKVQLDWLVRMQFPDGSVPLKMGNIDYNGKWPISTDTRTRYYGPKDSGATIYTAANFAHAARVYGKFPRWKAFAADLERRAKLAWAWYRANPRTTDLDNGEIKSGSANRSLVDQDAYEGYTAIHLFGLSGDPSYLPVIRERIMKTRQLSEYFWSPYGAGAGEALVDYLSMPGAEATVKKLIRERLARSAASKDWAPAADADLYRAWMVPTSYHWGSNFVRASYGIISVLAAKHGQVSATESTRLRQRASDLLHSFHGVNPLSAVYLSNMTRYGAELSMKSIYHERYNVNTPYKRNPPPGYVVGGPNQQFGGKSAEKGPSIDWIKQQPRAKAYADFNAVWPESSWELSEPAIYYQAMYIRLLAEFVE
ncbi:MAG: glycoside hydrolase family 9 protein [Fimbriimonadaceae bacterium]|nr:glycoside hydrolase family 9 protein [Fimbriimonadaceae bacterium]